MSPVPDRPTDVLVCTAADTSKGWAGGLVSGCGCRGVGGAVVAGGGSRLSRCVAEGCTVSAKSGIAWTDSSWSPVLGCSIASTGCDRCYAARLAATRLRHTASHAGLALMVDGQPQWSGEVRCLPERLDLPLRWQKPRRIFVCSQSDLFHPQVPAGFIVDVFARMALTPWHTYQCLTKRPGRQRALLSAPEFKDQVFNAATARLKARQADLVWPLPNLHLGVSVESDGFTWRADDLAHTPAQVRWVSAEPLLGPLPSLNLSFVDWIVVGAESGPGARPMDDDWARDLRDRAGRAAVPFFLKQAFRDGKLTELPELDGRIHMEFPA